MSDQTFLERADNFPMEWKYKIQKKLKKFATRSFFLALPFLVLRLFLMSTSGSEWTVFDSFAIGLELAIAALLILVLEFVKPGQNKFFFQGLLFLFMFTAMYIGFSISDTGQILLFANERIGLWSWWERVPLELVVFVGLPVCLYIVFDVEEEKNTPSAPLSGLALSIAAFMIPVTLDSYIGKKQFEQQPWRADTFFTSAFVNPFLEQNSGAGKKALQDLTGGSRFLEGKVRSNITPRLQSNIIHLSIQGLSGEILRDSSDQTAFHRLRSYLAKKAVVYDQAYQVFTSTPAHLVESLCGLPPKYLKGYEEAIESIEANNCFPAFAKNRRMNTLYIDGSLKQIPTKLDFISHLGFDEYIDESAFRLDSLKSFKPYNTYEFFSRVLFQIRNLRKQGGQSYVYIQTPELEGLTSPQRRWNKSDFVKSESDRKLDLLDFAIVRFFKSLENMKVDKDTLIVVTGANPRSLEEWTEKAGSNWVPLALMGNGIYSPSRETDAMPLTDLSLSLIDFLGARHSHFAFKGRSALRKYHNERFHFWHDEKTGLLQMQDNSGLRASCSERITNCIYQRSADQHFISQQDGVSVSGNLRRTRLLMKFHFGSDVMSNEFQLQPVAPVAH